MNTHRKGNIWNGKGIESKGQYGYRTKQGGEYNNVELHSQHNRQLVNCITVVVLLPLLQIGCQRNLCGERDEDL